MIFGKIRRKLAYWSRRDRFADDIHDEMRFHLELRARQLRAQGVPAENALAAARRQFGSPAFYYDASSAAWGWSAWERFYQDLRSGVRSLRKTPGFTAIAVLTLAVGLGINTAVFSVVNAVMLRALPYTQPERLISLYEETTGAGPDTLNSHGMRLGGAPDPNRRTVSIANLIDYRGSRAFTGLANYGLAAMNLTSIGVPERVNGETVSANFFALLGVQPELGRAFIAEDERPGAVSVVIISHDFWQRRLGGDTDVLARSITLDSHPYQVIGVLPSSFQSLAQLTLPDRTEFFVPSIFTAAELRAHGDHDWNVVGRLNPGVSVRAAQAELDVITARLAYQYPGTNRSIRGMIAPLRDDLVRNVSASLWALLGAAALIVLITCVNVANLLLVRAVGRRHEASVRLALGAGRFRIVRQCLAESLALAAAGCLAGLALGQGLMHVLISRAPANIPRIHQVTMDWQVFAAATGLATLIGLIFGIAPAWQASHAKPAESLKTTARTAGGKSQTRWRTVLTVAEVSLSLVLIIGAGLLLKSFVLLMGVHLGFQPDRVLAMNINLPDLRYHTADERLRFFQQLERRALTLPGVQSAAFANRMPLRGGWGGTTYADTAPETGVDVDKQAVSPGYFETLGIPLLRGRPFTESDSAGQPYVAVINQAFARTLFPGVDPIGRQIWSRPDARTTVIGVVNDIRRAGKERAISPQAYLPAAQSDLYPVKLADFAVRTAGDPHQLIKAIQSQVLALDKDQPIINVRTLDEMISASAAQRRFQTLLLMVFAGVAVALAMIGIFGVLSYSVNQRMNEFGVRVALGAGPGAILALVFRQAGIILIAGIALGLAGAYALTTYVASMLFQVQPHDWRTYAAAVVVLSLISLAASWIPARRGAKVEPIVALRYE